jgi:bifunctional DNA-binding transcriptional regulator/antitoxin component of YhaV-PrlF toxin-antitoxin module
MIISTLSSKHQTTLNAKYVKSLGLHPGTRLKQWVENGRIILEPVGDIFSACGALKTNQKFTSIEEETAAMEKAVAEEVMARRLNG